MLRNSNFFWLIFAVLGVRLLSMAWLPLIDTTEPRYAEIARLMVVTNDWITPWFEPGIPFWGKPPLSFWAQAVSFNVLGVNEFSARLPSWLATLATVWLLWRFSSELGFNRVAKYTVLIYSTSALVYIAAGAVLTDPFLALGTTWSMTAFIMAVRKARWYWRYGFFLGISIGLLAKGPLALVLTFGPIIGWCLLDRKRVQQLLALPWISGLTITTVLSLPWYILAELKTPGFLNYFIVGEHFMRFIDPGWVGDLYGSAHQQPKGMIWLNWLVATFPWGIIGLILFFHYVIKAHGNTKLKAIFNDPLISYLLIWAVFTPLFFTMAGNILWTYILPSIAAFSLLLALALDHYPFSTGIFSQRIVLGSVILPIISVAMIIFATIDPHDLKTEKDLMLFINSVSVLKEIPIKDAAPLYYLENNLPFSARFYSNGDAKLLSMNKLEENLLSGLNFKLVIPKEKWGEVQRKIGMPLVKIFENRRYILVDIPYHKYNADINTTQNKRQSNTRPSPI